MAAPSATVAKLRASLARRTQSYPPDHKQVVDARRDFAAAKIADYIAKVVAEAPPLTDEQRVRICALLRAGGDAA
jgi:hypothetical protein